MWKKIRRREKYEIYKSKAALEWDEIWWVELQLFVLGLCTSERWAREGFSNNGQVFVSFIDLKKKLMVAKSTNLNSEKWLSNE